MSKKFVAKKSVSKKSAPKKLFVVVAVETYKMRYLVEATDEAAAEDYIEQYDGEEWQQQYTGKLVVSSYPVTVAEAKEMHESNDGCPWMPLDSVTLKAGE